MQDIIDDTIRGVMQDIADHDIEALRMPDFDSSVPRYRIYHADAQDKLFPCITVTLLGSEWAAKYVAGGNAGHNGLLLDISVKQFTKRSPRRSGFDGSELPSTDSLIEHRDLWHRIDCRLNTRPTNHSSPVAPHSGYDASDEDSIKLIWERLNDIHSAANSDTPIFKQIAEPSQQLGGGGEHEFFAHETVYESWTWYSFLSERI